MEMTEQSKPDQEQALVQLESAATADDSNLFINVSTNKVNEPKKIPSHNMFSFIFTYNFNDDNQLNIP